MRIALLEDDYFERELASKDLQGGFHGASIMEFKNVREFLEGLDQLLGVSVVVMEHHLPLLECEESIEETYERIKTTFPDVVNDWDHQKAAERVIRHMRKVGIKVPVMIYTHSSECWISADVLQDPTVEYCLKGISPRGLIRSIEQLMNVKV